MDPSILAILHNSGLDQFAALVSAIVSVASALNMVIPQASPGSHWLPLRKLLNVVALAMGNAKSADEPPLATWIQRVLLAIAATLPPPPAPVPQAQPVAPTPALGPSPIAPIVIPPAPSLTVTMPTGPTPTSA
jgi:hypothetical protein